MSWLSDRLGVHLDAGSLATVAGSVVAAPATGGSSLLGAGATIVKNTSVSSGSGGVSAPYSESAIAAAIQRADPTAVQQITNAWLATVPADKQAKAQSYLQTGTPTLAHLLWSNYFDSGKGNVSFMNAMDNFMASFGGGGGGMTVTQAETAASQAAAASKTNDASLLDHLRTIAGNILSGGTTAAQGAIAGAESGSGQVARAGQVGLAGSASPLMWAGLGILAAVVLKKVV